MKSQTLPSFWAAYKQLSQETRQSARKSYRLWSENPFHPSLHFKCVDKQENLWSARISLGVRALGIMEDNVVTWFWIGSHDEYERLLS